MYSERETKEVGVFAFITYILVILCCIDLPSILSNLVNIFASVTLIYWLPYALALIEKKRRCKL